MEWRRVAQKLEAVIANPGTPEEGAAAAEKLKLIIEKHLRDYDNLHADEPVTEEIRDAHVKTGWPFELERGWMVTSVARVLGGCGIVVQYTGRVHVFGYGRELDRIVATSEFLLAQLALSIGKVRTPLLTRLRPSRAREYQRTFAAGWSEKAVEILESFVKPTGNGRWNWGSPGKDLAVRDRLQIITAHMAGLYPQSKSFTVDRGPGYAAGRSAGAIADVLATRMADETAPRAITDGRSA